MLNFKVWSKGTGVETVMDTPLSCCIRDWSYTLRELLWRESLAGSRERLPCSVSPFSGSDLELYCHKVSLHALRWLGDILGTSVPCPSSRGSVLVFSITCPCYSPACGSSNSQVSLVGRIQTKSGINPLEMWECACAFIHSSCLSPGTGLCIQTWQIFKC